MYIYLLIAKGPWTKNLNFIFPTKYVIPQSLWVYQHKRWIFHGKVNYIKLLYTHYGVNQTWCKYKGYCAGFSWKECKTYGPWIYMEYGITLPETNMFVPENWWQSETIQNLLGQKGTFSALAVLGEKSPVTSTKLQPTILHKPWKFHGQPVNWKPRIRRVWRVLGGLWFANPKLPEMRWSQWACVRLCISLSIYKVHVWYSYLDLHYKSSKNRIIYQSHGSYVLCFINGFFWSKVAILEIWQYRIAFGDHNRKKYKHIRWLLLMQRNHYLLVFLLVFFVEN